MSEKKQFVSTSGIVQQFKDDEGEYRPVVNEREVSNGKVWDFTIRSTNTQKLVRVSLFPEFEGSLSKIKQGALVSVDGPFQVQESKGKTYFNLTARTLAITPAETKVDTREVVNQPAQDTADEEVPF